ncbi:uncharacterized protein A4U43_C05F35390 [Asparagus officinalis]|uniref:Uncharacterized protein n=1 Tax=Asparagus officinalis TaxID=4686 RepID=A0A5P1EWZ0_ASPOF|nr:uncharacterized protein LOC109841380 [Asparagus officinalis]ONK70595.1 uncharacterized protein A4U43_C05F35390 [Asparagus officinalis]
MARILSQTLIRESQALIHDPPPSSRSPFFASRFINLRSRSKRPEKAQLLELDLGPEEPESGSGSGSENRGKRRLQEAIHAIIIRRAAPDWIPFVPGSSFWVPPATKRSPLTDEEELSFSSPRGWPSFSYFVDGVLPHTVDNRPDKVSNVSEKMENSLEKASISPEKATPKSDDEESGFKCADKISSSE